MANSMVPNVMEDRQEDWSDSETSHPSSPVPGNFVEVEEDFFSAVEVDGFPDHETEAKVQPWRALVKTGLEAPKDGKLIIACPKNCDWGSSGLGGY